MPTAANPAGKVDPASASMLTSSPCGPDDVATIYDLNFHGTFVGALVSSNGIGIGSVAPDASLIGVKVLNCTGSGSFGDIIAGIMYATASGADVINMSIGALVPRKVQDNKPLEDAFKGLLDALQDAVDYAHDNGVTVVASSGNDALDFDHLPTTAGSCSFPPFFFAESCKKQRITHVPSMLKHVLSVGATAPIAQVDFDMPASYTNFGRKGVDVAAPGGDLVAGGVCSTAPGGACDLVVSALSSFVSPPGIGWYIWSAGTSFAAPHVAGAAAVALAEGQDAGRCVTKGADRPDGMGNSPLYGKGRLNVLGAAACERLPVGPKKKKGK
jgi:subtilisin family serine protease